MRFSPSGTTPVITVILLKQIEGTNNVLSLSLPESVMDTFKWFYVLSLRMKSYGVTIQMKPL